MDALNDSTGLSHCRVSKSLGTDFISRKSKSPIGYVTTEAQIIYDAMRYDCIRKPKSTIC